MSHTRPINENDRFDPHGIPLDELQRREQAEQIREALNALSEEHRTILVLRGVEGFDYDQIAEILEVSAGTVRSRLHRARVQFRNHLTTVPAKSGDITCRTNLCVGNPTEQHQQADSRASFRDFSHKRLQILLPIVAKCQLGDRFVPQRILP